MARLPVLDETFARFDNNPDLFDLWQLRQPLLASAEDLQLNKAEREIILAEVAPAGFRPFGCEGSIWGTYFGPWHTWEDSDGTSRQDPDLAALPENTIDLWTERVRSLRHPLLRSRWADVIWDLHRKIAPERKRPHTLAQMAIDAYVDLAKASVGIRKMHAVFALQRAIALAHQINDHARVDTIVLELLALGESAAINHVGIWAAPFDNAFGKKLVSPEQNGKIVAQLESRLAEAASANNWFSAENAGRRLMEVYRGREDCDNVTRVLRSWRDVILVVARNEPSSLAVGRLAPVLAVLQSEGLREDAEQLRLYIEERGLAVKGEMKVQRYEMPVDQNEIEAFMERVMQADGAFAALIRLALGLLPEISHVRQRMKVASETYIYHKLVPTVIVGEHGQQVASMGSYDEDAEGWLIFEVRRELTLTPALFSPGYARLKEKFGKSADELLNEVFQSPLIQHDRREFLAQGLNAYEAEDYIKAIHVLVPQVESLLRRLLALMGIPITKTVNGSVEWRNMSDVLREERVKSALGERVWVFLKTLYTDKRGFNLRNDMAHGAAPLDAFGSVMAGFVIQSIVLLSALRPLRVAPDASGQADLQEPEVPGGDQGRSGEESGPT